MNWDWFHQKIHNKYFWLEAALLAFIVFYLLRAPLTIKDLCLTDASGVRQVITLPFQQEIPPGTQYVISGTIYYRKWWNCSVAHLIPDDHLLAIRLNWEEVSLKGISPSALRDYVNGFHYNFQPYLQEGANHIEILIANNAGPSGLDWRASCRDWRWLTGWLLLMALLLSLVWHLTSGTAVNPVFALILTGGFLLRALYFIITPFTVRTHDVGGHMHYIEYLVNNRMLPAIHLGWQTYQPPLYYMVAAAFYKLLQLAGVTRIMQIWRGVQFLSLLFNMGFLAGALQIVKNAVKKLPDRLVPVDWGVKSRTAVFAADDSRRRLGYLIFGLITFWPSGIIHAARLGNDALFYPLYAWGLAFLIKWRDDNADRSLYWSFCLITLALITKANSLVLYLVFGTVYFLKFCQAAVKQKYLVKTALLLVILLAGLGITFGRMVEAKLQGSPDHFLVANAGGLKWVAVGNTPRNYLFFDLPSFVTEPYVNPFENQGGRQYFWNYLLKTGLVGEFSYDTALHRGLTILLSILLLLMLLYLLISLIVLPGLGSGHLVLALNAFFLLGAAIAFRISIPASCSNDFRYIFPLTISLAVFFGLAICGYRLQKWRLGEYVGYGVAFVFMATSIVFFVTLAFSGV
ncbi:MAG: hypothetical protein PVG90_08700 [Bacillota bacterium]|jgi:hypothetical protein